MLRVFVGPVVGFVVSFAYLKLNTSDPFLFLWVLLMLPIGLLLASGFEIAAYWKSRLQDRGM